MSLPEPSRTFPNLIEPHVHTIISWLELGRCCDLKMAKLDVWFFCLGLPAMCKVGLRVWPTVNALIIALRVQQCLEQDSYLDVALLVGPQWCWWLIAFDVLVFNDSPRNNYYITLALKLLVQRPTQGTPSFKRQTWVPHIGDSCRLMQQSIPSKPHQGLRLHNPFVLPCVTENSLKNPYSVLQFRYTSRIYWPINQWDLPCVHIMCETVQTAGSLRTVQHVYTKFASLCKRVNFCVRWYGLCMFLFSFSFTLFLF